MVLYLVIIVVARSKESLDQGPGEQVNFTNVSEAIFRAVPIVTLAYTCQMNLFSLLTTLENPTRKRVRFVFTCKVACNAWAQLRSPASDSCLGHLHAGLHPGGALWLLDLF